MKLDPRRTAEFLRNPGAARAVLLYGEDHGLIRERAEMLVRGILGSLDDPFRLAEIDRDMFARIPEEASSLALTGGRRVIRVREATDGATSFVQKAIETGGDSLLVLEAGSLTPRSKLRALIERVPNAAAMACYREEGRGLESSIRAILAESKVSIEADALGWLTLQLGADRVSTRSELEKLALYGGEGAVLDLEAAMQCVGDMAGLQLDDALFAATAGDVAAADRAVELAMAEGMAPVGALRAALMHLQRLQRAQGQMRDGMSAQDAAKAARPPVYFKRVGAFATALERWTPENLASACAGIWETERACKRSGAPAETLCRNAVVGLARRAAARSRK